MTDMRECRVCGEDFDFDVGGLASKRPGGPFHVCSPECAKRASEEAGSHHVIHDETGAVVETNRQPGDWDLP